MGAMEDAVDAAAGFIRPFVNGPQTGESRSEIKVDPWALVQQAIVHLQTINAAELAAAPDSPYDTSLAGTVYGLLDLITSVGILPFLSPGVVFGQRPQSVIKARFDTLSSSGDEALFTIVKTLLSILEQPGTGIQPLLLQRILPDVLSALAELAFSPECCGEKQNVSQQIYQNTISKVLTPRLLPILTIYLQQNLPPWLKSILSKELAHLPLRKQGIRHTVEFLSLSCLSSNTPTSPDLNNAKSQSQVPIPLEAIAQASKLLVHPPLGVDQGEWLRALSPQLLELLDGVEGKEMSRAAGHIIASGILSKKSTGAPGTVGWETFAQPIIRNLSPSVSGTIQPQVSANARVIVEESELKTSLRRLLNLSLSYSHAGLMKRLVGPLLLPLWALLNYTRSRTALSPEWSDFSTGIISRYVTIAGDATQLDQIVKNIYWNHPSWSFSPGPQGGIEIREQSRDMTTSEMMEGILERIASLDSRITLFTSLLKDAKDDVVGSLFIRSTNRWLFQTQSANHSLTTEADIDPLAALVDAKLVQIMTTQFKDIFARSPKHVIELVEQLLRNFVDEHDKQEKLLSDSSKLRRADLGTIASNDNRFMKYNDTGEELVTFAMSILNTIVTASDFKQTAEISPIVERIIASLRYLSDLRTKGISPIVFNSANSLMANLELVSMEIRNHSTATADPHAQHRALFSEIMTELRSSEAPIRTWALNQLQKLIESPTAFAAVDIPVTTYMLLTTSLADPESYVYTAAIPVLVALAKRASRPVIKIMVDAFIDVDEQSLGSLKSDTPTVTEDHLRHAVDFRLRVGEVLDKLILDIGPHNALTRRSGCHNLVKTIAEACLLLASRRGQRAKTQSLRTRVAENERRLQVEGEEAWGGPIPDLIDPAGEGERDDPERDALLKTLQGWQDTGIEEDARIRSSALGVLASLVEHNFTAICKGLLHAVLQTALLVLAIELSTPKIVLRRAALLVLLGVLKGQAMALDERNLNTIGLDSKEQMELERVVAWSRDNDGDSLIQDHATAVLESLEALRMRELYTVSSKNANIKYNAGVLEKLRGLEINPATNEKEKQKRRLVVEEME